MRLTLLVLLLFPLCLSAQTKTAEDFGFRHLTTTYKGDTVNVLILSKKGEEQKPKPLFLFVQGSMPNPLIIVGANGKPYRVFVFNTDSLLTQYHLAIIGKPGVPLVCQDDHLQKGSYAYVDPKTGLFPREYMKRNYIDYYAERDKQVIRFLLKQPFIKKEKIVLAGHSEGGTVAARLAVISKDIGKLIFASSNPLGRTMIELEDARSDDPTGKEAEDVFQNWQTIVDHPDDVSQTEGDTYKAAYQSSRPVFEDLLALKIPVLITYGSLDHSGRYSDYLHLETIRKHLGNFTFKCYIGVDHNYFVLKPDGSPDYDHFNWDKVVLDWQAWLNGSQQLHALQ